MLAATLVTAALMGSIGLDVGAGLGASGMTEAGHADLLFGAVGPHAILRLHVNDLVIESSTDAGYALAAVATYGKHSVFTDPSIAWGSSVASNIVVGFRTQVDGWTLSVAAGAWAALVPYSCGDCESEALAAGPVVEGSAAIALGERFHLEGTALVAGGMTSSLDVAVRPALRLSLIWTFGDP